MRICFLGEDIDHCCGRFCSLLLGPQCGHGIYRRGSARRYETGLAGRYDLTLRWTPDDRPAPLLNGEPDPSAPPNIFAAIQEQLGLKLESSKGPVPVLVIDHVEAPSAN